MKNIQLIVSRLFCICWSFTCPFRWMCFYSSLAKWRAVQTLWLTVRVALIHCHESMTMLGCLLHGENKKEQNMNNWRAFTFLSLGKCLTLPRSNPNLVSLKGMTRLTSLTGFSAFLFFLFPSYTILHHPRNFLTVQWLLCFPFLAPHIF